MKLFISFITLFLGSIQSLKIMIHSDFGGRSHIKPILEISTELQSRSHDILYAAVEDNQRFLSGYSNITFVPLGEIKETKQFLNSVKSLFNTKVPFNPLSKVSQAFGNLIVVSYRHIYIHLDKVVKLEAPDVIICDVTSPACRDVAEMNGIPLISGFQTTDGLGLNDAKYLTHTMNYAPITTETLSFSERFYHGVVLPLQSIYHFSSMVSDINKIKKEFGVQQTYTPFGDFARTLGIANTFTGFEAAVPITPNIKQIGPIMSKSFPQLTEQLNLFLAEHSRTIYVGFGSNVILASFDIENIVLGCLKAIENGSIDGVIWGLGKTKRSDFPESFQFDNQSLSLNTLFNHHHFRILDWAPQVAILNHPNTIAFLSHGGLESTFEAIMSKTPILCMAFFGDQPRNAKKIEDAGIGTYIDRITINPSTMAQKIHNFLQDPTLPANLNRIYEIAKLNGRVKYAADLIESYTLNAQQCRIHQPYIYGQPGCEAQHLIPKSYYMNYIQAHQLDVYFLTIIGFLILVSLSIYVIYYLMVKLRTYIPLKLQKALKDFKQE